MGEMMGEMGPMVDPMMPRVLHSRLELTVKADGNLGSCALRVTWNDPMATMMEVGGDDGMVDFEDLLAAEPVEGDVHHYELQVVADPHKRTVQALKALLPLVK